MSAIRHLARPLRPVLTCALVTGLLYGLVLGFLPHEKFLLGLAQMAFGVSVFVTYSLMALIVLGLVFEGFRWWISNAWPALVWSAASIVTLNSLYPNRTAWVWAPTQQAWMRGELRPHESSRAFILTTAAPECFPVRTQGDVWERVEAELRGGTCRQIGVDYVRLAVEAMVCIGLSMGLTLAIGRHSSLRSRREKASADSGSS